MQDIINHIGPVLNQKISQLITLSSSVNDTYKVILVNRKVFFLKWQIQANNYFINEAKELTLLSCFVKTPAVFFSDEKCLILEWINVSDNINLAEQIGADLARLHRHHASYFGFNFDNKIGTTIQLNAVKMFMTDWGEFYWQYRLFYQIKLAHQRNLIDKNDYHQLLSLENKLIHLLPRKITPSLLHGDLWAGNVMSHQNYPVFIDSASYYGHREADFALVFMFGGFAENFWRGYNMHYPLEEGFKKRQPLYQLYHYLNHLNIFGNSYYASVQHCLLQLKSSKF